MARKAKTLQPSPVPEAADQNNAQAVFPQKQNPTGIPVHLAFAEACSLRWDRGTLCMRAQTLSERSIVVAADHGAPDTCPSCLDALGKIARKPYPESIVGMIVR